MFDVEIKKYYDMQKFNKKNKTDTNFNKNFNKKKEKKNTTK